MGRVSIEDALRTVEVDLWGAIFIKRRVTKTVQAELDGRQKEYVDAITAATDADGIVAAAGLLLDAILEPTVGDAKPSEIVAARWEKDELDVDQLVSFLSDLREGDQRPT